MFSGTRTAPWTTAQVKRADGARHVGNGRKEFVLASGERVFHHQSAAVGGVVKAFGRVDLQVLLGEGGVFLWHGSSFWALKKPA